MSIIQHYLRSIFLIRRHKRYPNSGHHHRYSPTSEEIQFHIRMLLKNPYNQYIMKINSFDKHPHKHSCFGVLQYNIANDAQILKIKRNFNYISI